MPASNPIEFWGRDHLKRWSESSLRDARIPSSSKQFLIEIGLPNNVDWTLEFDSDADVLPSLPGKMTRRRIGYDGPVPICIDEELGGAVIAEETESGGRVRFVNTSVELFGTCLTLYQEYRKAARILTEEEIVEFIPRIEEGMRKADPKAFDDPNNYWAVIVEQIKQGLL